MNHVKTISYSSGFVHIKNITKNNRDFLVYEKTLNTKTGKD